MAKSSGDQVWVVLELGISGYIYNERTVRSSNRAPQLCNRDFGWGRDGASSLTSSGCDAWAYASRRVREPHGET